MPFGWCLFRMDAALSTQMWATSPGVVLITEMPADPPEERTSSLEPKKKDSRLHE